MLVVPVDMQVILQLVVNPIISFFCKRNSNLLQFLQACSNFEERNVEGWSAVNTPPCYASLYPLLEMVHKLDVFDCLNGGEDVDGLPGVGIEIACFHLDGSHYMIYTPSDPLLFVAVKEKNGASQLADDELLDDLAVVGAIDEETEFNALGEEDAALLDSLLGKS